MKLIRLLRTVAICTVFLSLFAVTVSVILFSKIFSDEAIDNRLIRYITRNVTIQAATSDDQWLKKYPYQTSDSKQYVERFNEWKSRLENYCTVSFPESERINRYATALKKRVYHYHLNQISNTYGNYVYVKDAVMNILSFADAMAAEKIPFLYIQTPLHGTLKYYQNMMVTGDDLLYAQRNIALCTRLEQEGLSIINVAKETETMFTYDVSNHWLPMDALPTARLIAQSLNDKCGFSFDVSVFEPENYSDILLEYPHVFNAIKENCGYAYSLPVPKSQYEYTVTHAEQTTWKGPFVGAIIRNPNEWDTKGIAYHHSYRMNNKLMYEMINPSSQTNQNKTLLIIGDSFDWPLCAYLVPHVNRIILINNATFTGSIITYIRSVQPDAVIMAYNDAQFMNDHTFQQAYYLK